MKAVVVQSPGQVIVREVPNPVVGEYEVLCQVLAASVCSGTDKHMVYNEPFHQMQFPAILGHEGIGRVVEVGPKVRYLKVGDLVTRVVNRLPKESGYTMRHGAFAEYALAVDWRAIKEDNLPEEQWRPHTIHQTLPPGTSPVEATMVITWRETLAFLNSMQPNAGETLLVIGSGAQAMAFIEHGKNAGLIVAVIGSPRRQELFRQAGASYFVSYQEEEYVAKLHNQGFAHANIIIDAIGKGAALSRVLPLLKEGGTLGVYGLDEALHYQLDLSKAPAAFSYYYGGIAHDEGAVHDSVVKQWKEGTLNPWLYLSRDHIYPLLRAKEALEASWSGSVVKSVITF